MAQLADAARSDRAVRGSNPREPTIPSVAELAYAAVSNTAERIGLKSRVHVGSNPGETEITRGTEARTSNTSLSAISLEG